MDAVKGPNLSAAQTNPRESSCTKNVYTLHSAPRIIIFTTPEGIQLFPAFLYVFKGVSPVKKLLQKIKLKIQ